jgi:hypothetical protein
MYVYKDNYHIKRILSMISILLATYSKKELNTLNLTSLQQIRLHVKPILHGTRSKDVLTLLIMLNRYAVYQWEEMQDHNIIFNILLTLLLILWSCSMSFFLLLLRERELSLLHLIFNFLSRWIIPSWKSFYISLHYSQNVLKTCTFLLRVTIFLNTIDYAVTRQNSKKRSLQISSVSSDLMEFVQIGARLSLKVQWFYNQDQTIRVMFETTKAVLEISIHTIKMLVTIFRFR